MRNEKTVAFAGAAIGFGLFLGFGFVPALLYGGYAGLLLATGIFGAPLPATLFARGLVGFGMVLGVFATAAVFAVAGAGVGVMVTAISRRFAKAETAKAR